MHTVEMLTPNGAALFMKRRIRIRFSPNLDQLIIAALRGLSLLRKGFFFPSVWSYRLFFQTVSKITSPAAQVSHYPETVQHMHPRASVNFEGLYIGLAAVKM